MKLKIQGVNIESLDFEPSSYDEVFSYLRANSTRYNSAILEVDNQIKMIAMREQGFRIWSIIFFA